jgi:enamine deaminase RidA (YjgF/YER057c/UK114 family)
MFTFSTFNDIYQQFFSNHQPALAVVGVLTTANRMVTLKLID